MAEPREVVIERLGSGGDGVVSEAREPTYVPLALPGERWRLAPGEAAQRLTLSPDRAAPVCRHFGRCGGCLAQHMSRRLYAEWKHASVVEAFRRRGIDADVRPLEIVAMQSRRRAFLGVELGATLTGIGFREEGRHDLVDMAECPVLDPLIVAALPSLRTMARLAMPAATSGRLVVTRLDAGLDVAFENGHKSLSPSARADLARLAEAAGLVRLTVAGDPIVERASPTITLSGVAVALPPATFLQAVPEAEARLVGIVTAALPRKVRHVADLFSGLGTFTFPLARLARVSAYDGDKRAIAALEAAARHAQGLKPISALRRDLFREPLSPAELAAFDAVVLDPPRAGAAAQTERLARSKVPLVIAVSCAPATLARDARVLIDAGYRMGPVTAIDQFLFSAHTEAVAVFTR